jgi:hypothetical protein
MCIRKKTGGVRNADNSILIYKSTNEENLVMATRADISHWQIYFALLDN